MKNYVLNYIISSSLSEDEVAKTRETISSLIQNEGGSIVRVFGGKMIDLAYPIKKENKGYFELIDFDILPEKLSALDAKLKGVDSLLRFMIEHKKPEKEKTITNLSYSPQIDSNEKHQKSSLKEIDKKIEEILKS